MSTGRLGTLLVAFGLVAFATSSQEKQKRPSRLEIMPNAIQKRDVPMQVTVAGLDPLERVEFSILRDCATSGCKQIFELPSETADRHGVLRTFLDFRVIEWEIPTNTVLWLRARRSAGGFRDVRFGLVDNPCSLWGTMVDGFFGGRCDPHLVQALSGSRSQAEVAALPFEVRRLAMAENSGDAEPVAVPGTEGATGVAWLGAETLIATVVLPAAEEGSRVRPSRLLRLDRDGGKPEVLWSDQQEWLATAPLVLAAEPLRIAFVRQRLADDDDDREDEHEVRARLCFWQDGQLTKGPELAYPIHRLVGVDQASKSLLALTLGEHGVRPAFLLIDLANGEVQYEGFHPALYHAAMRSPAANLAAIAIEDNSGQTGWDLLLMNEHGTRIRDLQARPEHDLLPTWRPDGQEIAYLAEVPKRWRLGE